MRTPTHNQLLRPLGLLTVAALVIGLSGCGNDGGDHASDTTTTTTTAGATAGGEGGGSASSTTTIGTEASTDVDDQAATTAGQTDGATATNSSPRLPDPCTLVPLDVASQILGGQSAPPESGGTTATGNTAACSWQTQESKDHPTLDNAGHVLTLTVFGSPNPSMTARDWFESTKSVGVGITPAQIDGCEDAFWTGGMLSALKGDFYIAGTAGLADESPEAKAGASTLIEAACASLG